MGGRVGKQRERLFVYIANERPHQITPVAKVCQLSTGLVRAFVCEGE